MFFDRPDAFYGPLQPCNPPSRGDIERIRFQAGEKLFTGPVHANATSIYELNWLSVSDLLANWHMLDADAEKQHAVCKILKSSWDYNQYQRGLKHECPLIIHLMLMVMGNGIERVRRYGTRVIYSCLKNPADGYYSPDKVNTRLLNPPYAVRQAKEFERKHNVEKLFGLMPARLLLFEPSPEDLRYVGDSADTNADARRDQYEQFFDSVHAHLNRLTRNHRIFSYFSSCEISCMSIRDSLYRPHVHAVVWMEADTCTDHLFVDLPQEVRLLPPGGLLTRYSDVKQFLGYIFQVNSIAQVYQNEFREEDIIKFNQRTVTAWENMVRLISGDEDSRACKRIRFRSLPGQERDFVHKEHRAYKKRQAKREKRTARKHRIKNFQ